MSSQQHPRLFAEEPESDAMRLSLEIDDPDTMSELLTYADGGPRERFAVTALRIGVMAMRQARGQLDATTLRNESDKLLLTLNAKLHEHSQQVNEQLTRVLSNYFDPKTGQFTDRVQRLINKDGELESVLRRQVGAENSELTKTLASHFGEQSALMKMLSPDQSKGILANIRETLDVQLKQQREQVVSQFSLDDEASALSRFIRELSNRQGELSEKLRNKIDEVVKEFSLDQEDSALSRLVRNVDRAQRTITDQFSLDDDHSALARLKKELSKMLNEQREADQKFQEEVKVALKEMSARKAEADKSTRHGLEFEDALFEFVRHDAQRRGDVATNTGAKTGLIKNSKVGDIVVEMGPDSAAPGAMIVLEAKQDASYSVANARKEIEVARKNRGAQIGIFVFSTRTAPDSVESLSRYGDDIVVVWDAEDPASDLYLKTAMTLARALTMRISRAKEELSEVDFEALDKAILEIEKRLKEYDEIARLAESIQSSGEKIANRARISRKSVAKQVDTIQDVVAEAKDVLGSLE